MDDFYVKYGNKIIIGLMIFLGLFLVFMFVVLPSYISVSHYFDDNYKEIIKEKTSGGIYYPSTDKIVILEEEDSLSYKIIYLHENCHRQQHYQNRSYKTKVGRMINELECNIKQFYFWRWEE